MAYNYEKPIPLRGAHGVPVNRGWGWYWTGRQRWDGRIRKYFSRGSFGSLKEFKDFIEAHHHGIEFIDGAPADKEPDIVMLIPPQSFQHGIMDAVERELAGERSPALARPLLRTLPMIPRTLIKRDRILKA